jgi:MFS family permease
MDLLRLVGSRAVFSRALLACYGITAAIHLGSLTLNTLLPFHVVALGGSKTQVGLLFSVMTTVSLILRPLVGGWVDRFGARPVLVPGITVFALTSLGFQLAPTPTALIALMAGVGLANGLVSTSSSALVARASTPAHRGESLGTYYLANSLAAAVAPPLAFALLRWGGMRLGFAVVTAVALAMAGGVRALPAAVAAPVAGALPGFHPWSRSAVPLAGALILSTIGHSSIYAFLPLYGTSRGQGEAVVWFFAVYPVSLMACRALLRGLSDRIGRVQVILPAMGLTAAGFFALALPPRPASLLAAALLLGGGGSLLYPTLATLVVDRAPERERGLALGTLSAAWDLGVVLGSALVGLVVERASYGAGFALGGATATLGVAWLTLAERRHARRTGTAPAP